MNINPNRLTLPNPAVQKVARILQSNDISVISKQKILSYFIQLQRKSHKNIFKTSRNKTYSINTKPKGTIEEIDLIVRIYREVYGVNIRGYTN